MSGKGATPRCCTAPRAILAAVAVVSALYMGGLWVWALRVSEQPWSAEQRGGPELRSNDAAGGGGDADAREATRTTATAAERLSTMLDTWVYHNVVNPHIRPARLLDGISPPELAAILDTKPRPGGLTSNASDGAASFGDEARWGSLVEQLWGLLPADARAGASPPSLDSLCSGSILLRFAPWCGFERTRLSEWLLDPDGGDAASARSATTLPELRAAAKRILSGRSRVGSLSAWDAEMVRGIKWQQWAPPNTSEASRVTAAAVLGDAPAGSVWLRRTRQAYPMLLALRRDEPDTAPGTWGRPFDDDDDLRGFHACMYGSKRNLTSTIERLTGFLLQPMRPQRLHIVTTADGFHHHLPSGTYRVTQRAPAGSASGGDPHNVTDDAARKAAAEPSEGVLEVMASASEIAEARAALFADFLHLVEPLASTFLAADYNLATRRHGCVICRGYLPREFCRASLLSDMARGVPVELVMLFRPDMFMWAPISLNPYVGRDGAQEVQPPAPAARRGEATAIDRWRLRARPLWSLIVDHGILPTAFAVINDVNMTNATVVVHSRVTYPLDLHWIGDPIIVGHWLVMDHWLECFSVFTASARTRWIDEDAGEIHHAKFFRQYLRPLFELGGAVGVVPRVDLRVFDFQFSLYRPDPAVNAKIMTLPFSKATYQETTIFTRFSTKWEQGECMRYYYAPREFNVSSFYPFPRLYFVGEIGRIKVQRVPVQHCQRVAMPPGLQTCFAQYQRIVYYKKGNNIHNPCKPYCGVFPLLFREGLCAHVGNRGPRQRYIATFSVTPMLRNETGEVLRFNVINPRYVRGDRRWFEQQAERLRLLKDEQLPHDAAGARHANESAGDDAAATLQPSAVPTTSSPRRDGMGVVFKRGSKRYRFVRGRS